MKRDGGCSLYPPPSSPGSDGEIGGYGRGWDGMGYVCKCALDKGGAVEWVDVC